MQRGTRGLDRARSALGGQPFAETARAQVGPDLVDVRQTGRRVTGEAVRLPTHRQVGVDRPDRVLLLIVDNDVVLALVLSFFHGGTLHRWVQSPGTVTEDYTTIGWLGELRE